MSAARRDNAPGVGEPAVRTTRWFADLPGLGVREYANGVASYIVQARMKGRPRTITIGRASVVSEADARQMARHLLLRAQTGEDPASARAKARATPAYSGFLTTYWQRMEKGWKPSTKAAHDTYRRPMSRCAMGDPTGSAPTNWRGRSIARSCCIISSRRYAPSSFPCRQHRLILHRMVSRKSAMPFDEDRRTAAIRALPVLSRTLFLLHNFHDVDIRAIAEESVRIRTARRLASPVRGARSFIIGPARRCGTRSPNGTTSVVALGERLRLDYRASLAATFVECGYVGTVQWPAVGGDIHEDENAAAAFIASQLHPMLREAVARSQYDSVAMLDLWRKAPPWRRIMRDHLLQVASELLCSGWRTFEAWLADRIAPDRHYPDGIMPFARLRRPLPGEMDTAEQEHCLPHWPDDADRQARFDNLPILTRNSHEIARRLGISRRDVRRRCNRAFYAIAGWTYPNLAWRIYCALSGKRTLWAYRLRKARAALRE